MRIININGPINSGKTTVSKLLHEKLPDCLFIEVDELLSDEEQKKLNLTREDGWAERLKRLKSIVVEEKKLQRYENIIFAYPMSIMTYHQWKLWEDENTKFINITLAPKLDICLQNRGERKLTESEKQRIKQMYEEGYNRPEFFDLIIDNSSQRPIETLKNILYFLIKEIK
ncbi:MAG: adenylyl-sulfate kinase [Alphaproteobacteria bacterium]|nr:adenylyl-sulfate kinase [Alphaproteobacteria bacterium]